MLEAELITHLKSLEKDCLSESFLRDNAELMDVYNREPYGDEEAGKSKYVSGDVADVVEADMPSLVRVFLGSNEIMKFEPLSEDEEAETEAHEKTQYINYLIRNQSTSYKTIFDWLKGAEIYRFSTVKAYQKVEKYIDVKAYSGLDEDELTKIKTDLEDEKNVLEVDVMESSEEEGAYSVKFKIVRERKTYVVECVLPENFLISKHAKSLEDAELIGDICLKKRGDLIREGFDKELVNDLPMVKETASASMLRAARWRDSGDDFVKSTKWATEEVEVRNLYPLVDDDGDGIAERRHIMRCGDKVLLNEWAGKIPYAVLSSMLMPNRLIGKSRAEIVAPTQYLQTHLQRQVNDNLYQVNRPRTAVNGNVNVDDLMVHRTAGVVRASGSNPISQDIMPLVTPYIGDSALQIIQHIDARRAQTTGSLMASQGLNGDEIGKETATRFRGVEDASKAKVELVARGFAETGFRQLYELMAWLVSHHQDSATEIRLLGKTLSVDPTAWKYEHICTSLVGLGAGDDEVVTENMGALLNIHHLLRQNGSQITDDKKVYNTVSRLLKAMGEGRVSDYINDPEKPDELLLAQNQQLMAMVKQMGQANPLAEAEQVKAQAAKEMAMLKAEEQRKDTELEARLDMMKEQVRKSIEESKLEQKRASDKMDAFIELLKIRAEHGPQAVPTELIFDPSRGTFNAVPNS